MPKKTAAKAPGPGHVTAAEVVRALIAVFEAGSINSEQVAAIAAARELIGDGA